jgi:hypothetical protein
MIQSIAMSASALQIASSLLLLIYLGALAILAPRELNFLSGVPREQRAAFIAQDLILQLCILMVLVPSLMLTGLDSMESTRLALIVVVTGFGLLWLTIIWMVYARQRYVHQLLRDATRESREQLERLKSQLEQNREENGE